MTPSKKSPQIEEALTELFGFDRREYITKNLCPFCKKPAETFRDEISKREFSISGLCQDCQDKTFGV